MDWGSCILCQKHLIAPWLNPSHNRNKTVCWYVKVENNIEEYQRKEIPFPVGILVHLQESDGIIRNFKKEKVKWHKNCALGLSTSKYVKE